MFPLLLGAALLAGLGYLVWSDKASGRKILLVNGTRYALVYRSPQPGVDLTMFGGFCEFSDIVGTAGPVYTADTLEARWEFQFSAQWCAANTVWTVPDDIAITEL
jgi:hypothetical protein